MGNHGECLGWLAYQSRSGVVPGGPRLGIPPRLHTSPFCPFLAHPKSSQCHPIPAQTLARNETQPSVCSSSAVRHRETRLTTWIRSTALSIRFRRLGMFTVTVDRLVARGYRQQVLLMKGAPVSEPGLRSGTFVLRHPSTTPGPSVMAS